MRDDTYKRILELASIKFETFKDFLTFLVDQKIVKADTKTIQNASTLPGVLNDMTQLQRLQLLTALQSEQNNKGTNYSSATIDNIHKKLSAIVQKIRKW